MHHHHHHPSISPKAPTLLPSPNKHSTTTSLGSHERDMDAVASTDQGRAAAEEAEGLKKGIASLYDESSELWESIWGVHMHHGFYEPRASASAADHRLAQVRMVEEALAFAGITGLLLSLSVFLFFFSASQQLRKCGPVFCSDTPKYTRTYQNW